MQQLIFEEEVSNNIISSKDLDPYKHFIAFKSEEGKGFFLRKSLDYGNYRPVVLDGMTSGNGYSIFEDQNLVNCIKKYKQGVKHSEIQVFTKVEDMFKWLIED